ncbi:flagellar C1a complex subunit C1a-32-domain-containing protein [Dunaliella salina]|uniref:Flagellar C1a complex subunit C1a-32-domain-containing protein n=1 Tax=Dunaliella salina TaxID=3046 RepID=A0ABQ7GTH5_DUNSA|nr:flagellar C1a complex subunit C1a-32-domain-containing protein [Dunaliella salina]|eukprot:KAF5837883.1 flagellar C1a complex subunit C1a-32-domain-containing protein [Dunaliella salina]
MAYNLVWRDLSSENLEMLRNPHMYKNTSPRDLLARLLGIREPQEPKSAILLDFYVHTLQFGQELEMNDEKLSGLFSLMKEVHRRSTEDRMALEPSFVMFKELLLAHSVHRPPYSIGLFTHAEFRRILAWALDSYYRHYKLYQYVYTNSALGAPCLAILVSMHRKLMEEEAAAAAAAEAEKAEAERVAQLREEYESAVPEEIKDRVAEAVERELARLKEQMEAQFQQQHAEVLASLAAFEGKVPEKPPAKGETIQ